MIDNAFDMIKFQIINSMFTLNYSNLSYDKIFIMIIPFHGSDWVGSTLYLSKSIVF